MCFKPKKDRIRAVYGLFQVVVIWYNLRSYLPMQNLVKIFSSKSSVVISPVISPKL